MIVVTGATGHIGNVLVRELISQGEQVRAMILPGEDLSPLAGVDVEKVNGDVLDPPSLERAFEGADTVFHLAGIISILPGKNEFVQRVNVEGTRNVIQAIRKAGVRRMVYTSSIHAIQRVPHGVTVDENLPFDPHNNCGEYDRSKAQASLAVLESVKDGLDAVIACPTGVIGPYDFRLSEMGHLILDCMRSQLQILIRGAYDFVDVRDVARGLVLAWKKGRSGQTYILSGEQISINSLAEKVQQLVGRQALRLNVPLSLARFAASLTPLYYSLARTRPLFTPYSIETVLSNSIISHAKAQRELGYTPRPLSESLSDTVGWFKENVLKK